MQERGRTQGSRWETRHQLVLWWAAILDNLWEALSDLSRGVVEHAVKAAGGGKRRNISGQARSLVRVSPLWANDLCYDLTKLAKLIVREQWAWRRLLALLEIWSTKRWVSIHEHFRSDVWRRWSWAARASDLCLVAIRTFVLVNTLGKRVFVPVVTRFRVDARRMREFLGRALSSAKVSDLGSKLTGRLLHFDGRGGMIDDKTTELTRSKLLKITIQFVHAM